MDLDFAKMDGLLPAIVQDSTTKDVLMLGFMNEAAWEKTRRTGHVTFWSRTRHCLWTKGETSGNFLVVERLWVDDWDIDLMVITGGGGTVLAPYLKPQLSGEVLALDATADARLNNVRGYWKYGMNVWGKELRASKS